MRHVYKAHPGGGFTSVPIESDKELQKLVSEGWSTHHPHPELLVPPPADEESDDLKPRRGRPRVN